MDESTYQYLEPTLEQKDAMKQLREAAANYHQIIDALVPGGPDKTYLVRKLREVAMWANVAVTRQPDGAPRS